MFPAAQNDNQDDNQDDGMDLASALGIKLPDGVTFNDLPQDLVQQLLQQFLFRNQLLASGRKKLSSVNTIENVIELINKCTSILVLTGAGISVSAGIPDFRSENGLYKTLKQKFNLSDPTTMFDMKYFVKDPSLFYSFGGDICPGFDDALIKYYPTPTHYFIKSLELKGKLLRNYTQNIDTLEMRAGINNIITCHGSYVTASCINCEFQVTGADIQTHIFEERIPYCPYCQPLKSDLIIKDLLNINNGLSKHSSIIKSNNYGNIISIKLPKLLCTVKLLQEGCPILFSFDDDIVQKAIYDMDDNVSVVNPNTNPDDNDKKEANLNYKLLVIKCDDPLTMNVCKEAVMYWLQSEVKSFGVIKPDITFFHESLSANYHNTLETDIKKCDLLLILGTSLQVQPVASIPTKVPSDIPSILINREVVGYPNEFDVNLLGNCDDVCNTLLSKLNWDAIKPKKKDQKNVDDNINNNDKDKDIDMKQVSNSNNNNNNDKKLNDNSQINRIKPIDVIKHKAIPIKYEFTQPNYYVFPNGKLPDDIVQNNQQQNQNDNQNDKQNDNNNNDPNNK